MRSSSALAAQVAHCTVALAALYVPVLDWVPEHLSCHTAADSCSALYSQAHANWSVE